MTDDVDELMHSDDWQDRCRAVAILDQRRQPGDPERLKKLLHDERDKGVAYRAAPALLAVGDWGWQTALESVWWDGDEDDFLTSAVREAMLDLHLAGEDVGSRLRGFIYQPRTDSSRRGAMEMMIALQLATAQDFDDQP